MKTQERYKIKSLLRKSRIASKKKYMRQADRRKVLEGILSLQKLGIYDKTNWIKKGAFEIMSEFISWLEHKDKIFFLKDSDLDTKEGRAVYPKIKDDICGHGAIKEYYHELKDKSVIEKECTDFSTPANFPKEIVQAIKKGQMSRIGICLEMLNEAGKKEYEKIEQPAWAEYKKIKQPALAEYEKIEQSAWAEYKKIEQATYAEYEKIKQSAWAEYKKIKQSAFWKIARQKKYRKKKWR